MKETIVRLEQLLESGTDYISQSSESVLSAKASPEQWSKKEILGHLIDSGINNLKRFTEIQFEQKPYKVRKYNQDELIKANHYQDSPGKELVSLWLALNQRILFVIKNQTAETLKYEVELSGNEVSDLGFLIKDYVDHLEHHLNQILKVS